MRAAVVLNTATDRLLRELKINPGPMTEANHVATAMIIDHQTGLPDLIGALEAIQVLLTPEATHCHRIIAAALASLEPPGPGSARVPRAATGVPPVALIATLLETLEACRPFIAGRPLIARVDAAIRDAKGGE
jgi:hypothetical protein